MFIAINALKTERKKYVLGESLFMFLIIYTSFLVKAAGSVFLENRFAFSDRLVGFNSADMTVCIPSLEFVPFRSRPGIIVVFALYSFDMRRLVRGIDIVIRESV